MNIAEVENLEVDGVDIKDYPDFCDAYFLSGTHIKENRPLTEKELDQLSEDYPEILNEMAIESLI